ncbi:phage portal protein [Jeotgalibacillus aurantiacus]|uniref:phage portal protein n=1 Tax=Jeotgalibacillus aurantiacus TaxID=2763266 RepID=UPI001D0B8043|nr:phage portal protein [Jeotgalibacillus aurantiacus]
MGKFWDRVFGLPGQNQVDEQTKTVFETLNGYTPVFNELGNDPFTKDAVRSAINAIATNAAKLSPKHIRRTEEGIAPAKKSQWQHLISRRPNEIMSAFDFYYKTFAQLYLHNNAFIYLKHNSNGVLEGLYPIEFSMAEMVESKTNQLYIRFQFLNGKQLVAPYEDFIHLRRFYVHSDLFGESNEKALRSTLSLLQTSDDGIVNAVKSSAYLRGLIKYNTILKDKDLVSNRDSFVKDYLDVSNNGGVAALDSKADYTELKNDPKMVDSKQMSIIQDKVYRYFNISEAIVTSSYDENQWNAFYESVLEPLAIQFSQEFTEKLFTKEEQKRGNEIIFEANRLAYASNTTKISLLRDLAPLGLFTINEGREIFNMAPVDGGDERIKTLNVVNAAKADEYQLGKKSTDVKSTKGGETDDEDEDDDS